MAWTDEQKQIVNTHSQLMDLDELAELVGKSRRTIYQYLYRNNIEFKQKVGGSPINYSDEVIANIRLMAEEGKKLRDIAKVTGISIGYISRLTRDLDRTGKVRKTEIVGFKQCCINLLNSVFKDG